MPYYFIFTCILMLTPLKSQASESPGITGGLAPTLDPIVNESSLSNHVNISTAVAWGGMTLSNTHYILTADITASGSGLQIGSTQWVGINNCVIDLNGHTITYGTSAGDNNFGIYLGGSYNVLIKGPGTIVQSDNAIGHSDDNNGSGIAGRGNFEVSGLSVVVVGKGTTNIHFQHVDGFTPAVVGGRVHDCFLWNKQGYLPMSYDPQESYLPPGHVIFIQGTPNVECYNNIVIGAHISIGTAGYQLTTDTPFDAYTKIHHNKFFNSQRILGYKSPAAIEIYAAKYSEVYENQICTLDSRGIIVQMSSYGTKVYHNTVDARYTRAYQEAADLGYPILYQDNTSYGQWLRHGFGDLATGYRDFSNIYIASNWIAGNMGQQTNGMLLTTGVSTGAYASDTEVYGNLIISKCKDQPTYYLVKGIGLNNQGVPSPGLNPVKVHDCTIWAGGTAVYVQSDTNGTQVNMNTFYRGETGWGAVTGSGSPNLVTSNNTTVNAPSNSTSPATLKSVAATTPFPGTRLITWTKSSETDVLQYNIYRNGEKINTKHGGPIGTTFFVDLEAGLSPKYSVTAVNLTGIESGIPLAPPKSLAIK